MVLDITAAACSAAQQKSSLAGKVPKIRKTGNTARDYELELDRANLVEAISLLERYPAHRASCVAHLRNIIRQNEQVEGHSPDACFKEVSSLARIDDHWLAAFLSSHSKLSVKEVGLMKTFDAESPKHLMSFAMAASAALKLPDPCIVKSVLNIACSARIAEVGDRLAQFSVGVDACVLPTGQVNWGKCGAYRLVFEGNRAARIVHRPTTDAFEIDADIHITEDFVLKEFWSDLAASVEKGPRKYKCADFFPKPTGPHRHKILTGKSDIFHTHVNNAVAKHSQAQEALAKDTLSCDVQAYSEPMKEKRKEATSRARAALAKSKVERASKRRHVASDAAK